MWVDSLPNVGDGHLTFNDGIVIMGIYRGPYYWVDDHPSPINMEIMGVDRPDRTYVQWLSFALRTLVKVGCGSLQDASGK